MKIKNYIEEQFKMLDRGFVATPADRDYLERFAQANGGSADFILMQMAINFGYKIALENLRDEL